MNQSIIGVIVFFVFLSTIEASSNPSFIDSISIPGAKCIISIPMDSNSLFSSFEHPCSNYYFFKLGNYRHVLLLASSKFMDRVFFYLLNVLYL